MITSPQFPWDGEGIICINLVDSAFHLFIFIRLVNNLLAALGFEEMFILLLVITTEWFVHWHGGNEFDYSKSFDFGAAP